MSAPSDRPTTRRAAKLRWLWIAAGLAVIAALVVAGGLAQQTGGASSPEPTTTAQEGTEPAFDLSRRIEGDPLAWGAIDAPVVIVEYSDFRCPFCALFARDTLPLLLEEYVDEGLVRLEWRDLPVFGEESMLAAVGGRAAAEQGRFWEFQEAIYADAPQRGHPDLSRERLLAYAEQSGVPDIAQFTVDLDDPALRAAVTADQQEGFSLGATGTPTFLVNDTPLVGAQPIEAFRAAIDQELREAG